ncbi:hypothetical protein [Azospirillum argentinense]|uniref:hypothetical protein n=1 Tax=Azospirillum argentinense TaxID=2970906 RepID=UPI0032E044EA
MYTNAAGGSREGAMYISYVLWKQYGIKQADIGKMFGVSQSAIASWVKEVGFQVQIKGLKKELEQANDIIRSNGLIITQQTQQYIPHIPSSGT